jgi:hypothetical protein
MGSPDVESWAMNAFPVMAYHALGIKSNEKSVLATMALPVICERHGVYSWIQLGCTGKIKDNGELDNEIWNRQGQPEFKVDIFSHYMLLAAHEDEPQHSLTILILNESNPVPGITGQPEEETERTRGKAPPPNEAPGNDLICGFETTWLVFPGRGTLTRSTSPLTWRCEAQTMKKKLEKSIHWCRNTAFSDSILAGRWPLAVGRAEKRPL